MLDYARRLRQDHPEVLSVRWFGSWERIVAYLPESFPVGLDLFVYNPRELEQLRVQHPSFSLAIDGGIEV